MMHKGGKIRPPRKATRIAGVNDFDQNWNFIQDALVDIHDQNAGRLSFEQLYRASYKIVLIKRGEDLYQRVKAFEERYFADKVIPHIWALVTRKLVSATLHNVPGSTANERRALAETFLRGIKDSWERHNMSMNMVADVLMYLDRGYAQDATRPFIYATTIGLFRDHILRAPLPPSAWSETDQFVAMGGRGMGIGGGGGGGGGGGSGGSGGSGAGGVAGAGAGGAAVDSNGDVVSGNPSNSQPTIFTILNSVIFDLINMDRDGDVIDHNLARSCVAMLEALYETDDEHEDDKLYLTTFEPEFLHATYLYYHNECERLLRDGDARAWLRQTRRRLREEQERCGHTISQLSRTKVARVVERELVATHLEDFLALEGSGIKAMIDNDRLEDLAILYDLVCRVESKKTVLKQALQTRIIDLGLEIEKALKETDFSAADATKAATLSAAAQQTAAAIKWVTDILDLKEKFDRLWLECFNKDIVIQSAMTSSFTELFRLCMRSAEYVSLFIDDCFKRGLRGKSDTEIDAALDKATVMIQHVTEKDMLERYYQKHLARRLLHNKSENPEAEKMLISRMQSELGKTFTAKFEGMFKDMATSEELTRDYGKYAKENLDDGDEGEGEGQGSQSQSQARIDLGVSVLTSNNWPPEVMGRQSQLEESLGGGSSGQGGCIYPAEVQRLQASFLKFYLRNRSGRVLSWVGTAGSADMRCVFPPVAGHDKGVLSRERRYELSVPTYGMVVLLLFNALPVDSRLSFDEIQAKTNIPVADLTRALASLTIPPKCRVLTKEPASKTIRQGDQFGFNAQFASKTLKIKVPIINALSKIEGEDERKATEDKNNQTRSHTIDAAVVRIMKQRKELAHTALVTEVVTQLASLFRPEVAMVKKRIEDLISREYLERIEESDPPAYRYVA